MSNITSKRKLGSCNEGSYGTGPTKNETSIARIGFKESNSSVQPCISAVQFNGSVPDQVGK